ncbi:hypothetical protein RRG08_025929 [Elysia crispata]|uniref:Uncharacterized protein n=1 Tax=Elysia crispata TaxID=231223 RepID=A0AAE0ZYP6_9GAST|nr:hypothetical protein RRG08_025929 [Elysia crispata]
MRAKIDANSAKMKEVRKKRRRIEGKTWPLVTPPLQVKVGWSPGRTDYYAARMVWSCTFLALLVSLLDLGVL